MTATAKIELWKQKGKANLWINVIKGSIESNVTNKSKKRNKKDKLQCYLKVQNIVI